MWLRMGAIGKIQLKTVTDFWIAQNRGVGDLDYL
jgi:hypothetical protein